MKGIISSFTNWCIVIATIIVFVLNPIPRLIYGALGWSVKTQIVFFISIMLPLAVVAAIIEQRKSK